MEMHQVRYFLAAADELNFTKAAERCNVSQPSLTRAIKQLEGELGGDLFRRERPQTQLTDLGARMYPLMKQIYDSALGAQSLASSIRTGELGSLRLALSHTVELALLAPHINELRRLFGRLELKLQRGTAAKILELLKAGEVELGVASDLGEQWDRLDHWPLFNESFQVAVDGRHNLASKSAIDIGDLRGEPILRRSYCEHSAQIETLLRANNLDADHGHEVDSERDLILLLEAGLGAAILPGSTSIPPTLAHWTVNSINLRRTVYVYSVAGRQRSAVASALLKSLRAADWARYEN